MMKLSAIEPGGTGVGENRTGPQADQMLERWGCHKGSVRAVRFRSDFVFGCTQRGVGTFLHVTPVEEKRAERVRAETALLVRVGRDGLNVAQPVMSRVGNLMETIETGAFHGVGCTALNGIHRDSVDVLRV
ncbi:MAG: hypothetical protein ACP5QO_00595 [Clostridia bacterium]